MNSASHPADPPRHSHPVLLSSISFVVGAGLAGFFLHRPAASPGHDLAAPTRSVLEHLRAPVTVHYYSLLPGDSDPALSAFAARVAALLDQLHAAGGSQLQITRFDTPAETNAAAASAGGIQPFNLDKGDACFLGLELICGDHKETLARLQPEWEPALEYDLARAIERISIAPPAPRPAPEVAQPAPEIIRSIQQLIPNVNTVSLAEADRIFHDDYLQQCVLAGQELEAQINAAGEQIKQAQSNGSAAGIEAARKQLLQVQLAQGEKLKALASRLQTQLAVFQRLKAGAAQP